MIGSKRTAGTLCNWLAYGGGGAAGVETAATGTGAGAGSATGAVVAITGWKSVPFLRVILKPSFSILKTERSFFLISAMSSLMSFKSKFR